MKKALIVGASIFLPVVAGAQQLSNIETLVQSISRIINIIIPIVFALALLFFFWGVAQYILNSGNDEAQKEGRSKMIWGIVALFVMSAVWGLVRFLGTAVGVNQESGPSVNPLIPKP
jgi:uncharacterized membrane-anchored protein